MLLIREKGPTLNYQAKSIPAKPFTQLFPFMLFFTFYFFVSHLRFQYIVYRFCSFAFDNGDMLSLKRHVFVALIFMLKRCTNSSLSKFGYSTLKLTIKVLAPTPAVAFFSKPSFYYSDPCISGNRPLILAKTLAGRTLIFETFYVFRETEVLTVSVE